MTKVFLSLLALTLAGPAAADPAADRTQAAEARLNATPAGKLVLRSTQYHGGLAAWYASGGLAFRYNYQPVSNTKPGRDSLQVIDLLSSHACHEMTKPKAGRIGWDGTQAWATFEHPEQAAARFWALTPYYFVGMPFVLSDQGVNLEIVKDDPADMGLKNADAVRITFEAGTGDAPDDYYIAYLAKDTGRMLALRYVVSYKPFMAKAGIKHTPEKVLIYENDTAVGPLKLAVSHSTYKIVDGKRAEKVTQSDVTELKRQPFDPACLKPPAVHYIDRSMDAFQGK